MKRIISLILCAATVACTFIVPATAEPTTAGVTSCTEGFVGGDVDGDGKVNAKDAAFLLKYIAGWQVTSGDVSHADTQRDGVINGKDAAKMLKYLAGWQVGRLCHDDVTETVRKPAGVDEGISRTVCTVCGDYTETAIPAPVIPDERTAVIRSGDSTLVIRAGDTCPSVTNLYVTGSGNEAVSEAEDFALPANVDDGINVAIEWEFDSMKTYTGESDKVPFDAADLVYTSTDGALRATVTAAARPSLNGPVEISTSVENLTDDDIRILPGTFASFRVTSGGDFVTIQKESGLAEGYTHHDSSRFSGTGITRKSAASPASAGIYTNTFQNFNSSGSLPIVFVDRPEAGFYCALAWSSGRISARSGESGIRFTVDMDKMLNNTGDFATVITSGTSLDLPPVWLGVYDGTLDDGSNTFKHWFFDCKAPAALRDDPTEPLTQEDMQSGLDSHGVESIKWDYGWWTNDSWGSFFPAPQEGSWELRSSAYKGVLDIYGVSTMAEFGKLCADRGLNWTVYLLLHDTIDVSGEPTDAFGEFNSVTHPEWFGRTITPGMGMTADLGDRDCVGYLKGAMADFFNNNNVRTWRSDFEPISYYTENENTHEYAGTDVMFRCTEGFADLVTSLYENVPGFRYESCSSGGSMKDLFTPQYAVVINCDDSSNYLSLRTTFYDGSYVICPAQLQLPCNTDTFDPDCDSFWPKVTASGGDGYDFRGAMLDMGFRTLMLGAPMFSSGTVNVRADYYEKYSALYKNEVRPLVRDGNLYHILPRPDGVNFDGVMYADPDSANDLKGMVFLFKPSETPGNTVHVTLAGLDPDKTYDLSFEDRPEQNTTATGASLMTDGIDVTIEYVGSELIRITEH